MPSPRALSDLSRAHDAGVDRLTLFETVVDRARSAIAVWESFPAGAPPRLAYVNAAFTEITGIPSEDVIGTQPSVVLGEQSHPELLDRIDGAVRVGASFTGRITLRSDDGEPVWVDALLYRVPNVGTGPFSIVGAFRDLSDHRADEDRFRALIENVNDVVAVIDTEGRFSYVSPSVQLVLGFTALELVGTSVFDRIEADRREEALAFWANVLEQPEVVVGPVLVELFDRDGILKPLELLLADHRRDPAVAGVVVTARDVTERVAAEESVRRREEWVQALMRRGSDLILLTTVEGTITWASPNSAQLIGREADGLVGISCFDLVHPDDLVLAGRAFAKEAAGDDDTNPSVVLRIAHADGAWRWLSVNALNMLGNEAVASVVVSGRDVTERMEAEQAVAQSERRFRALVHDSSDVIVLADDSGRLLYASPAAEQRFGIDPADMPVDPTVFDRIHPDDQVHAHRVFARWRRGDDVPAAALRMGMGNGGWRWYEFVGTNRLEDPDVAGIVINGTDITERRLADELLADETAILEAIARGVDLHEVLAAVAVMVERNVAGARCSVGVIGVDNVIRHPAAPSLSGKVVALLDLVPPDSELGRAVRRGGGHGVFRRLVDDHRWGELAAAVHREGLAACWTWPVVAPSRGELLGLLTIFMTDDRAPLSVERPLFARAQHLAAIAIERARFEARLEHQALHDSLTGLPNRTLLLDRIEQALATCRRAGQLAAVLFVDLDRFKVINDSLGHAAGDRLLEEVAERFSADVRAGDTIGRFGGDEFVVLAYVGSEKEAVAVAERLADSLEVPFEVGGAEVVVTCSIGIALADGRRDPEALVRDADAAMYRAKEEGRNRYAMFEERLHRRMVRRLELERGLREALTLELLEVHYQPVVRVDDLCVTGVEALVRWNRPGRGLVGASELVPVAEETGLIVPIGAWVLERACRDAAGWIAAGYDITVAVNLSARQLADPRVVETVAATLARTELAPERLCLEVTESALAADAETAVVVLGALKLLGARLAIDDFGTGYATLDYVRRFSMADELKIDKSFVDGLTDLNVPDAAIVSAAIVLADALGFDTVAEGVENPEQLAVLRHLGCRRAQGYLFAEALPADRVSLLFPR
ncbi:MAG: hypothetical protein QOE63_999 [Acidimicrobiaceae bacterium]